MKVLQLSSQKSTICFRANLLYTWPTKSNLMSHLSRLFASLKKNSLERLNQAITSIRRRNGGKDSAGLSC